MITPHFIFDAETLGQDVFNAPVLDFSYLIFDWDRFSSDNPYTFDELLSMTGRSKLKVSEQIDDYGCVVGKETVEWWKNQGPEARKVLVPSKEDISLKSFLDNLIDYIGDTKIKYWWSRSNTFDPILLQRIARDVNQGYPERIGSLLKFWLIRDTRTFIDARTGFKRDKISFIPMKNDALWESKFKAHSSRHDIVADALRLQTLVRVDLNLEIPE